jgi:hypothetical protein
VDCLWAVAYQQLAISSTKRLLHIGNQIIDML